MTSRRADFLLAKTLCCPIWPIYPVVLIAGIGIETLPGLFSEELIFRGLVSPGLEMFDLCMQCFLVPHKEQSKVTSLAGKDVLKHESPANSRHS